MSNFQFSAGSKFSGGGGKIFGTIFFAFFLGMGLIFVFLIGKDFRQRLATYRWQIVPCTIVSSRVAMDQSSETPYHFEVRYEYKFGGQDYRSDRFMLNADRSGDYSAILRQVLRYPVTGSTRCFVDPNNPSEAVLERSTLWFGFMMLIPLPFVLIGGIGMVAMWRGKKLAAASQTGPLSKAAPNMANAGCLALFFSIFFVVGLAAVSGLFIRPALKIMQAGSWQSVPCTIVSSQVRSHRGDKGTTYSPDILYRYQVQGREYLANRYSFGGFASSGYNAKAAIVARYRPGVRSLCYVNPTDPVEAVLERRMTAGLWIGLIPGIFAVVGAGGLIHANRLRRKGKHSGVPGQSGITDIARESSDGPVQLKPAASPLSKFAASLAIALFWNGIVSVFVYHIVHSWRHGPIEWFLTLFMIPFVLIGLGIVGYVVYAFVGLFNPRVKLTISSSSVLPGATIELDWKIDGNPSRVRRLNIYLEGREEATYRRGTRTSTDKDVFVNLPIADVRDFSAMLEGRAQLTIPSNAIHSFDAASNKIKWAVFICAEVSRMPDIKDEFGITVLPQPIAPPLTRK